MDLLNLFNLKKIIPAFAFILIFLWQASFFNRPQSAEYYDQFKNKSASGLDYPEYVQLSHWYFQDGYFPIFDRQWPVSTSLLEVAATPGRLLMEKGHTVRAGEYGKLFLFWPDRIFKGKTSVKGAQFLLFVVALWLCWFQFFRRCEMVLGTVFILLLGSNPFQIASIYFSENIFSVPISVFILTFAAFMSVIRFERIKYSKLLILCLVWGIFISCVRQIRTEPSLIWISLLVALLIYKNISITKRTVTVLILLSSFYGTNLIWKYYWSYKIEQSQKFVQDHQGIPLPKSMRLLDFHVVWHPLLLGLGDYQNSYDIRLTDLWAYEKILPVLREQTKLPLNWDGTSWGLNDYLDPGQNYYEKQELVPGYEAEARRLYFDYIKDDPVWFLIVLGRRALTFIRNPTPINLALAQYHISFFGLQWLLIPLLIFWFIKKQFTLVRQVLFFLPLCIVGMVVWVMGGVQLYSVAHVIAIGLFVTQLILKMFKPRT